MAGEEVDPDDVIASGAVMGLLGLTPLVHGKPGELPPRLPVEGRIAAMKQLEKTDPRLATQISRLKKKVKPRVKTSFQTPRTDFGLNMKFVPPESMGIIEQYNQGKMPVDKLMSELKARGDMYSAFKVETETKPYLERFIKGDTIELTKMTLDDAQRISNQMWEVEKQARRAEAKGAGNAPELRQQADQMMDDAFIALSLATEARSAGGAYLGAHKALERRIDIGEQAAMQLAKQKKLNREAMVKIKELQEVGDIQGIRKMIGTAWEPKLKDKLHEVWKMGLLSSPMTWGPTGVNVFSNLTYAGLRQFTKMASVPIDSMVSGILGGPRTVKAADIAGMAGGARLGLKPALKSAIEALKHERTFDSGKLEMRHGPAVGGTLGKVVRFPGRALTAADEFFRTFAQMQETGIIAAEKLGRKPKLEEITKLAGDIWDNPKKHVNELNRIKRAGDEAVFTTSLDQRKLEGGITGAIGAFGDLAQTAKHKGGLVGGLTETIAPFVRTPTNIAIEAIKTSPFGIFGALKSIQKYKLAEASGASPKQLMAMKQQLATDLSKVAVGTAIFEMAREAAEAGYLTGGGPAKYEDYQKWIEAGNQPYSTKIGDTWVSYQRVEPFASIMGAAADIKEIGDVDEDKLDRAVAAVKDNLANKTFLMGVENFAKAWASPERYGANFLRNLAGTVVPTSSAMGWAARAADPVARIQSVDGATPGLSAIANVRAGMSSRIPGLRSTLEPRYSTTGRVIQDEHPVLNAVLPMKIAPAKSPSIVETELDRLARSGYTVPSAEKRRRKVPGLGKTALVTPEEYKVFADTNKKAAETLERIMSVPSWESLEDDTKVRIISQIYRRYRRGSSAAVRRSMANRLNP
jgi:hypothetical protein